jgi:putative spermidine/putrescine transport system permease protein
MRISHLLLTVSGFLLFAFIALPIVVVLAASLTPRGYLEFPPQGLSFRWYIAMLTDPAWLSAFGTSVLLALLSALATTAACFAAALVATRRRFMLSGLFETAMLSPLILPHAALSVALLSVALTLGVRGEFLGLLVAHIILTLPFAYRPMVNGLRQLDLALEEAAMTLGATPGMVFRRVTIPLMKPAIVSAFLFSFIISFDEVTVSLFLIGPDITTLPVKIFTHIQESASPVVAAVSTVLILLTLGLVLAIERIIGLQVFVNTRGGAH